MAAELGVGFRLTSGPIIPRAGDLAAILTNLQPRDVLFIDEIHRLQPTVEEILYPAMEDYKLDLMIGEGPAARSIRLDLPPFTLVGATTRTGLLTTPLRDRFGIVARLEFYEVAELEAIVLRGARLLGLELLADAAHRDRAARARHAAGGDPAAAPGARLRDRRRAPAGRWTRPWPTAPCASSRSTIWAWTAWTGAICARSRSTMAAARSGSTPWRRHSRSSATRWRRRSSPILLQQGLLQRTPRGRLLTRAAWRHLGLSAPAPAGPQRRPVRRRGAVTAAHELAVRVYYEDTDAAGIVYHSNYLKFAERGRTELLRSLGFDHPRLAAEHGLVFAVARCTVDFVRPARLDDLLAVRTEVVGLGGARIEMVQLVDRDGAAVARLGVTLAVLDARAMRPTRLPEALRRAFDACRSGESQPETINLQAIRRCS